MRRVQCPPASPEGLMPEGLLQKGAELPAGDETGAEAPEMGGFDLAVDEVEMEFLQAGNECDEGRLGGVRPCREHRFAEEDVAEGDAVKPAHKRSFLPDLDGVDVAEVVEGDVGLLHLLRDPGAVLAGAGLPTGGDHLSEGMIESDPEKSLFQELSHAARDAEFPGEQNEAGIGRPPEERLPLGIPGEYPLPVGGQKPLRREVSADGQQAAVYGVLNGGKGGLVRESIDRHGLPG